MNIPLILRDRATWLTAAPLWDRARMGADAGGRMGAPVILRFEGDDFMAQAQDTLAKNPGDLARYVARAESWRAPTSGWDDTPDATPITLFHPIHNRFYLAAATLVCQRPGLPDRRLDRVGGDVAAMVMRRLAPSTQKPVDPNVPSSFVEQAWIGTQQRGRWVTLDTAELPGIGEDRLPMFPMPYREGDHARRLHAAVIPVARANGYDTPTQESESRASAAASADDRQGDARQAEIRDRILGGLAQLAELSSPPAIPSDILSDMRIQTRTSLVLSLLDLAQFLNREAPGMITALRTGATGSLNGAELALFVRFDTVQLASGYTARQALLRALDRADQLDSGTPTSALLHAVLGTHPGLSALGDFASALLSAGTPLFDLIFPTGSAQIVADPRVATIRDAAQQAPARITADAEFGDENAARDALLSELLALDSLLGRELPDVAAALPDGPLPDSADAALFAAFAGVVQGDITWARLLTTARAHAAELIAGVSPRLSLTLSANQISARAPAFFASLSQAMIPSVAARPLPPTPPAVPDTEPPAPIYVLRALYERPACAGIHPPTLSAPSRAFHLASFYDADAPVRPLKIEMPARTSIADLRKAPKNVSIQLSKELRKQMSRVRDAQLSDPLDEQLGGEGGFDFGVICSLSIPIITICALLLLMIIVQLLNIVFWWLPYFMICFPVKK